MDSSLPTILPLVSKSHDDLPYFWSYFSQWLMVNQLPRVEEMTGKFSDTHTTQQQCTPLSSYNQAQLKIL